MYCSEQFNAKYLDSTMKILNSAAVVSVRVQAISNDQDTLEFLASLREGLLDQYTFILMGLNEGKCINHAV